MRRLAIALAAGLALGACTLFDDAPTRTCRIDNDCFRAQGERCNTQTRQCEPGPDAAAREADEEPAASVPEPTGEVTP